MSKPSIGLLMGIMNEAGRIEECLAHHMPFVDQVVIIDQDSHDGTKEIIENIKGDSLIPFDILNKPVAGCSEIFLQEGADLLKTDWILYVDADERFPLEFLREMSNIADNDQFDGFWLERDNWFDIQIFNDAVPIEPKNLLVKHPARDRQLRFTRHSMSWFPPQIHVRCRVRGKNGDGHDERMDTLDYRIYHLKSLDEQWIDNKGYMPAVKAVEAMEEERRRSREAK